jgi:hypothetical protein
MKTTSTPFNNVKINFMKSTILLAFFVLTSLVFYSCGPSTQIEKTWTDPSFTKSTANEFHKILVMALVKDESSRRIAEDKMVTAFKNVTSVQSYQYLQSTDTVQSAVEDKLRKDGFDGIVVMRLADVEKNTSYVPGTGYGGWYGYRYSSPGYYQEDKTFYVETNFYSLTSNKLLWSGTTSSLNPTKLDKTVDEIIEAIRAQLQKQGLVKS